MGPFDILAGAASGLMSGAFNEMFAGAQQRREQQNVEHAAEVNYEYGEKAADNAQQRDMENWTEKFNTTNEYNTPEAQVRRMKDAGLSVGLMYGGAGNSGTAVSPTQTGAQGGGAGNQQGKAAGTVAGIQATSLALDAMMKEAQIQNIKADTKEKEAVATKTAGVDTEMVKTSIEDVTENIANKQIQRQGMILQNQFDSIRNYIAENTKDMNIERLGYEVESALRQSEILWETAVQAGINTDNLQEVISTNLQNTAADTILKYAQTEAARAGVTLTQRQTQAIGEQIELQILEGKQGLQWLEHDLVKMGIEINQGDLNRLNQTMNHLISVGGQIGLGYGVMNRQGAQHTHYTQDYSTRHTTINNGMNK